VIWLQTPTVFGVGGGKFLLAMECTREWRKLHNEERNNLYSSPNIIRMIKSRWMRKAGNVAHM